MRIADVLSIMVCACGSAGSTVPEGSSPEDSAVAIDTDVVDSNVAIDSMVPEDTAPAEAAPETGTTSTDYGVDGKVPYAVAGETATFAGKTIKVTVYMPTSPGLHPVVGFAPGNSQPANGYFPYAQRLATHGIATILRDDPGTFTRTLDIATDLEGIIGTWMPMGLAGKVDVARVGLAGHSRGGAVSLLAAERGLKGKVRAWFGVDPVDNQFAISPGAFARTEIGALAIPTAFLGASVTSSCAPDADNYKVLYPTAPKPSLLMVGVGAGHTQFATAGSCSLCGVCTGPGTADGATVLAYSVRYLTAFFARELLDDKTVGAKLEGEGTTADVTAGTITLTAK